MAAKKIFISYRREDTPHFANVLRLKLGERFGKDRVFVDISGIRPGQKFEDVLKSALEESDVLIAVIGKKWQQLFDARNGQEDYVRQEVSMALGRRMIIIPVLDDTDMPERGALPAEVKDLVGYQARRIAHESLDKDVSDLIEDIQNNRKQFYEALAVSERSRRATRAVDYGRAETGRFALVIGNSAYRSAPVLNHPVNDAAVMTRRLKSLGFSVSGGASVSGCNTGLHNGADLDRVSTFKLLGEFSGCVEPGSCVVIYYAGAAVQLGNRNYLVPVDEAFIDERQPDLGMIDLQRFVEVIAARVGKDGVVIVFLDACRDNPLTPEQSRLFWELYDPSRPVHAPSAPTFKLTNEANLGRAFYGFATMPGQLAFDGKKGSFNSPFARALDEQLGVRGLEIEEMFRRVSIDVRDIVEKDLGRKQEAVRESQLGRQVFLNPPTLAPVVGLGLFGGLVGLLIAAAMLAGGALDRPPPWVWGMGAVFGLVAAIGTAQWGERSVFNIGLAFLWPVVGFAMALALIHSVHAGRPEISTVNPEAMAASGMFLATTLGGGLLFLTSSVVARFNIGMRQPGNSLGWLVTAVNWFTPVVVLWFLLRLHGTIVSGSASMTGVALTSLMASTIYGASASFGCRSQGGIFGGTAASVGGAAVGLLALAFFQIYTLIQLSSELQPSTGHLLLAGLSGIWHALLGAQLGYCFALYVPDHKRIA